MGSVLLALLPVFLALLVFGASAPAVVVVLLSSAAALLFLFFTFALVALFASRTASRARRCPGAGAAATAALTATSAFAGPAAPGTRSGSAATAGVRAAALSPGSVFDETNLSAVDLGAIQLLQGPLHICVKPELDHPLILASLMGVCVRHFSSLPHVVLEVLPATATGKILNNKSIICSYRRAVSVSSPTPISTF